MLAPDELAAKTIRTYHVKAEELSRNQQESNSTNVLVDLDPGFPKSLLMGRMLAAASVSTLRIFNIAVTTWSSPNPPRP